MAKSREQLEYELELAEANGEALEEENEKLRKLIRRYYNFVKRGVGDVAVTTRGWREERDSLQAEAEKSEAYIKEKGVQDANGNTQRLCSWR